MKNDMEMVVTEIKQGRLQNTGNDNRNAGGNVSNMNNGGS